MLIKGGILMHNTNNPHLQHIRFIKRLDLPQDVLDKICFKNSERLFIRP